MSKASKPSPGRKLPDPIDQLCETLLRTSAEIRRVMTLAGRCRPDAIAAIACIIWDNLGVAEHDFKLHRRSLRIVQARQAAAWLAYAVANLPAETVARWLHQANCTVVLSAHTVDQHMQTEPKFAAVMNRMRQQLLDHFSSPNTP